MNETDGYTKEVIERDEECYFIEDYSVFIKTEENMKKYLKAKGWSEADIEDARTDDEDSDNATIYYTTYGGGSDMRR